MAQGEVSAAISQMRDSAVTIGNSATRVNDAIEATDTEVKALGPDRFASDAAEAFRAVYSRLTPQLKDAYQGLMAFQKKLNDAADDVETASRSTT